MKLVCPFCKTRVPTAHVNVSTDVALCPNCDEAFSVSAAIAAGNGVDNFNIACPPAGAWFADTGANWQVGATTRSWGAFFIVPFTCVWSGFSIGGIYGTQIANAEFNVVMSLFGIPFLVGSLILGGLSLMSICGKMTVSVAGHEGGVFTGVGSLGWTRRFDWLSIQTVEEDYLGYHYSGSSGQVIALVGQSRIRFGSMLSDARRYYLLQTLRKLLANRS